jgi:protein O-mannosyl-transferase
MNRKFDKVNQKQATSTGSVAFGKRFLPVVALLLAGIIVYWNSFNGDFVFDDISEIRDNPSIRVLWPPHIPMFKASELPTRPIPYYSFALNYAVHGAELFGYHVVNLCIHLVNALLIFLLIQATLSLSSTPESLRSNATAIAFSSAAMWVVHPLNTEAVTYIYQRIESSMTMFFLSTFYLFIRSEGSCKRSIWLTCSVATAAIGMGCKEVMVVVPVVIALYEYAFLRRNIRDLIRVHWKYYTALIATWSILFSSIWIQIDKYGNTTHNAWQHLITQPQVIFHYLRLSFLPFGQSIDLGWRPNVDFLSGQPEFTILLIVVFAAFCLYPAYPRAMFLPCLFFIVLSPTSSFVPVADLADEYRMYLPLAAITTGLSTGLVISLSAFERYRRGVAAKTAPVVFWLLVTLGCLALGLKTVQRNVLYQDKLTLWRDTVEQSPMNPRAHTMLAVVCLERTLPETALWHSMAALSLEPGYPFAELNAGLSWLEMGRPEEAVTHFRRIIEQNDASSICRAENNLGLALLKLNQREEAIVHFRRAIALNDGFANAYLNLGNALRQQSEVDAIEMYRKAIEVNPEYSEAYNNLGLMLTKTQPEEALNLFKRAIRLDARNASAYSSMGNLFTRREQFDDAIQCYRKALEIDPSHAQAQHNLDVVVRISEQQSTN